MGFRFQHVRRDALTAMALASLLGAVWTVRDWSALSVLRLPDTDDGMRLQQIRNWLAGQAFADLTQYRLGTGVPMHWSRLADLVPGGAITVLSPLIGRHAAELSTVIAWPILLFAGALYLVTRIGRAVGGEAIATTTCIVAAIAYPATTIFLPGRIDHHGLQVVLLLGATLAALGSPRVRRGLIVGGCAAASLVVGLETIPLFAVLGLVLLGAWIVSGVRDRLLGLGVGGLVGLIIARAVFAPIAWTYPACDGFTAQAWTAATIASLAPLILAIFAARLDTTAKRVAAAAILCVACGASVLVAAPGCASPYGAVDPVLARLWLSQVGEAQSIGSAPVATVIGYCGVMVVGLLATLWRLATARSWGWVALAAVQVGALAITAVQLRGAYAGTLLAAPALAAMIGGARARGILTLAGAWVASAGMLYPIAAQAIWPARADPDDQSTCASPAVIATLARLPAGTVMAPIDVGGFGIPATPHRFIAGPYHRDGAGNLAMFRFYRGTPAAALAIARDWHVDYVLACPGLSGARIRGTMAGALLSGSAPGLYRIASPAPGVTLFRPR